MTEPTRHCAWCGGPIPVASRSGRPRRYCKRSHRQRAFEARRNGARRGLADTEAVVSAADLAAWKDHRYLLQAAMDDGDADLAGDPTFEDLRSAYANLRSAAAEVLASNLEPSATGGTETP